METVDGHREGSSGDRALRERPVARAWLYFRRALRLRCPECGVSRLFVPMRRTRSLDDWFKPLDGCPRCGYAYEREDGYFLLAIWGIHYFVVTGIGLTMGLLLQAWWQAPLYLVLIATCVPTLVMGFFFIRHAKSIYLAIDHYCDPHRK